MNWTWAGRLLVAIGFVCAGAAQAGEPALPPLLRAQLQGILTASNTNAATVLLIDGLGVSGALQHGKNSCLPACAGPGPDALVALLAMRLAEQGRVDLYASLPLPTIGRLPAGCKTTLTLSHLLEHTSAPPGGCPGNQTAYHGSNHKQAASLLEKATQTSMADLMQRELFKPLGMAASQWKSLKPERSASSMAGHDLATTPLDIAQLVQMLVQRGQTDGRTYLPQCAVERMGISVSAVSRPGGNTAKAIARTKYGLGLERFSAGGLHLLGDSGTLPGSQWVWGYSSAAQSGMVIMLPNADAATLSALKLALAGHLQRDAVLLTQR